MISRMIENNKGPVIVVADSRNSIMEDQVNYLKNRLNFTELKIDLEQVFSNKDRILDNYAAYSGVSGRQFRRHPDIKPKHTDILSNQFLLTLFLINNYHLVHIKLKDLKEFDLKALLFFPIKFCSIIVYP